MPVNDQYLYRVYQYSDGSFSRMTVAYRPYDGGYAFSFTTTSPEDVSRFTKKVGRHRASGYLTQWIEAGALSVDNNGGWIAADPAVTDKGTIADAIGNAVQTWLTEAKAGRCDAPRHAPHRMVRSFQPEKFYRADQWRAQQSATRNRRPEPGRGL